MTNEWFECKAQYEKTMDNGMVKKVTETYLVEAVSFADAEKRFIEEITPFMTSDFEVSAVGKRKFSEIMWTEDCSADRWYKAKLIFITLDEKSGAEKKSMCNMLVQAADFHGALQRLDEGMKGSMMDYTVVSLMETGYMDLFKIEA